MDKIYIVNEKGELEDSSILDKLIKEKVLEDESNRKRKRKSRRADADSVERLGGSEVT